MDDESRIERQIDSDNDNYDNEDIDEDAEDWPAGLLASQASGAGTGTASAGSLAAGPIGAAQAGRLVEAEEPTEERSAHTHVPAAPEEYGSGRTQVTDQDVSPQQKEAESDELNG